MKIKNEWHKKVDEYSSKNLGNVKVKNMEDFIELTEKVLIRLGYKKYISDTEKFDEAMEIISEHITFIYFNG